MLGPGRMLRARGGAKARAAQEDCSGWFRALEAASEKRLSKAQQKKQGPLDHLLKVVFDKVGVTNRRAAEFGFQYMHAGNPKSGLALLERYSLITYKLRKTGWNVTYFDAIVGDAEAQIVRAVLTEDNIAGHFQRAGIPIEADFFAIDVDSVDIWLLNGLLKGGYRPRVLVIECNPNFSMDQLVVFERKWHEWTKRSAYGASAGAINMVAKMYGYTIVQMPSKGLDMLLVRSDLIESCAPSSVPSPAQLAAKYIPWRIFPPCIEEDVERLRDFPLALQGLEEEAKAAARKTLIQANRNFPRNPVCVLENSTEELSSTSASRGRAHGRATLFQHRSRITLSGG